MTLSHELAELFTRDLRRLEQQIDAIDRDELLWRTVPGVTNSIGNLTLHLEGNLREFLGLQLGDVPYSRVREKEFSSNGLTRGDLLMRLEALRPLISQVLSAIPESRWSTLCSEKRYDLDMTWRQFAIHLLAHLSYHLGQIDYLRRTLTGVAALSYAGIDRTIVPIIPPH